MTPRRSIESSSKVFYLFIFLPILPRFSARTTRAGSRGRSRTSFLLFIIYDEYLSRDDGATVPATDVYACCGFFFIFITYIIFPLFFYFCSIPVYATMDCTTKTTTMATTAIFSAYGHDVRWRSPHVLCFPGNDHACALVINQSKSGTANVIIGRRRGDGDGDNPGLRGRAGTALLPHCLSSSLSVLHT